MRRIVHFIARRLGGATLMGLLGVMLSLLVLAGCARKEVPAPEAQPATSAETAATPSTTTAAEAVPATTETAPETTAAAPVPAKASTTRSPAPPTSPAPGRAQSLPGSPGTSAAPTAPATPAPEPQSAPAGTSAAPAPVAAAPAAPKVDDPGGPVAVASTNPGATRIGPEKCKICHKIQYASWAEGPHARRSPPLECESCHGPGSEYKTVSTMKDLEKAKAAGLVLPDAGFCATCHKRDWKSDMLSKAHAHKPKPAA